MKKRVTVSSGWVLWLAHAVMHRRILEISQHQIAEDVCRRLNSQVVRFQFRTVLCPGRSTKSLQEHKAIVDAIANQNRKAAEAAMKRHLTHVAETSMKSASAARLAS